MVIFLTNTYNAETTKCIQNIAITQEMTLKNIKHTHTQMQILTTGQFASLIHSKLRGSTIKSSGN